MTTFVDYKLALIVPNRNLTREQREKLLEYVGDLIRQAGEIIIFASSYCDPVVADLQRRKGVRAVAQPPSRMNAEVITEWAIGCDSFLAFPDRARNLLANNPIWGAVRRLRKTGRHVEVIYPWSQKTPGGIAYDRKKL